MTVAVDLTRARELRVELSHAIYNALPEDQNASRQLALMASIEKMLPAAEDSGASEARVNWTCSLLVMLEDEISSLEGVEQEAIERVCKAIASVQAALGVPKEHRAWMEDESETIPEGTVDFVRMARYMMTMLRPVAEEHAPRACGFLVVADEAMKKAEEAQTLPTWRKHCEAAQAALSNAANEWASVPFPASYHLWGVFYGVEKSLSNARFWIKEDGRSGNDDASDADTSIHMLPGEHGERGGLAHSLAVEIALSAQAVRTLNGAPGYRNESPRVQQRLLERIQAMAGVIMSALDGDDTMENLYERAGMENMGD